MTGAKMISDINPPDCPAQYGNGTDIAAAGFVFTVRDQPAGAEPQAEVTASFCLPGQPGNALRAPVLRVPAGSLPAETARRITADQAALARLEDRLRASIALCRCRADRKCPVLANAGLITALSHSVPGNPGNTLPAGSSHVNERERAR